MILLNALHDKENHILEDHLPDSTASKLALMLSRANEYNQTATKIGTGRNHYAKLSAKDKGLISLSDLSMVEQGSVSTGRLGLNWFMNAFVNGSTDEDYRRTRGELSGAIRSKNINRHNLYVDGYDAIGNRSLKMSTLRNWERANNRLIDAFNEYNDLCKEINKRSFKYAILDIIPLMETSDEKMQKKLVTSFQSVYEAMMGEMDAHRDIIQEAAWHYFNNE